jgi:glutaredoxin
MSDHPEDARLAAANPLDVTLYSRPGCHLCEDAKAVMNPLLSEFGVKLREVNIDEDPEIAERYCWDIPVVFLGRHKAAKHKVDPRQFRRQLEEAKEKAQGQGK